MPDVKTGPATVDWDAEVKKVLDKIDRAAERFEQHVKPADYRALETKLEKAEKALAASEIAFRAIEQLPNEEHEQRGPLARAALAEIAASRK